MLVYSEMLLCMAQRCLEIEAKQKGATFSTRGFWTFWCIPFPPFSAMIEAQTQTTQMAKCVTG